MDAGRLDPRNALGRTVTLPCTGGEQVGWPGLPPATSGADQDGRSPGRAHWPAGAITRAGREGQQPAELGLAGTSDVEPAARRPARRDTEPGQRSPHPSPQASAPHIEGVDAGLAGCDHGLWPARVSHRYPSRMRGSGRDTDGCPEVVILSSWLHANARRCRSRGGHLRAPAREGSTTTIM